MSKRQNISNISPDTQQTFYFDSKIQEKISKYKKSSKRTDILNLDFSMNTSQVIRQAQFRNQNILELLEQSEHQRKTQKNQKTQKNVLWDFFARFQKQSNPDITISDIEIPNNKKVKKNSTLDGLSFQNRKLKPVEIKLSQNQSDQDQNYHKNVCMTQAKNQDQRYPKRNRIQPLKYWLGQKCVYKNRKIVDIIKIHDKKDQRAISRNKK